MPLKITHCTTNKGQGQVIIEKAMVPLIS